MAWQGGSPYYQDPNYGGQPGYPPNPGYPPPQGGYPQGGYPQGGYPQGGYPQGGYAPQPGYPPQPGFVQPPGPAYGTGYPDPELGLDDEVKGFGFSDESIRKGFIRKVYAILSVQMLVTFGFVMLFSFVEGIQKFVYTHSYLVWVALGISLVTVLALACCESVRRNSPTNFIVLGIFTLAESFLMAAISASYKTDIVMIAIGLTLAVCIGLTLFAFQTKWDFTVCGGVLFVAIIIFTLFGIISIFFRDSIMNTLYSSFGVLLFSIYLIYDTQLMMGGNHKYSISPEEYIFAALNLYLDIINIFIHILSLLGSSKN